MGKHFKIGLLPKVVIAIASGILCSYFLPVQAVRVFVTFNSFFGNFLSLFIPVLILGLIAPGIADLGSGAGKLLLVTVLIAFVSTLLAGLFSFGVCTASYPHLLSGTDFSSFAEGGVSGILPYFTIELKPFMTVTSSLAMAFILGMGVVATGASTLKSVLSELRSIVMKVISSLIVPCLPIFIFGIFLQMGCEGKVGPVLGTFINIIVVVFFMHVTFLLLQFIVAGAVSHKNPFRALVNMLPAYFTALGTQSSAATIPVTLAQTRKNGVRDEVADFTVPLCATIHLSCSMLKIVACAFAISFVMGMDISFGTYMGFMLMLTISMIAAPGVPGGAIMAALGVLEGILGFDASLQGLMIALYIAMDSFGTAGNVTGDGAIAMIVNKIKH